MATNKNRSDKDTTTDKTGRDSNPDPITGAPGSHPVATGVGAAAGGTAAAMAGAAVGAAIGSAVPGPGTLIGGAVGAVIGAVGGGYAGKAAGEAIDPTGTDDYWREHHKTRSYYKSGTDYNRYQPAYQYGARLATESDNPTFDETRARRDWESSDACKTCSWDEARPAVQDEFNRRIQLREEQLRVSKDRVKTGDVHVRKEVTTETQRVDVPVEREEVVITRHPASGHPGQGGQIGKSEEIRVPVSEERVNVSKETVVTGEVDIEKRKVTDKQTVSDTVRKENLKVDSDGKARVDDRTKR